MNVGDPIPNRVSVDEHSPHYHGQCFGLGVKINGVDRFNVTEFDKLAGWAKVHATLPNGKPRIERGRYVEVKVTGKIEPYWRGKRK